MFGGRSLHSHWQTAKRVIGDGWHGAVKLAGQLDQGMRVSRRLFGALQPALDQFAGGAGSKHVMDALKKKTPLNKKLIHGYNQGGKMCSRIKRQVPELDL